jgi:NitT/TauT family transport system substrate-binding protein
MKSTAHSHARRGGAITVAAIALAALVGCTAAEPEDDVPVDDALGGESCEFTFGTTPNPDPGQLPTYAALDAMRDLGCDIETEVLEGNDLLAEGLVQGRYQIVGIGSTGFFSLYQQDAPVIILLERNGNDWALVGETGISDCQDVYDAGSLGITMLSGLTWTLGGQWFEQGCPDLEPPFAAVPGGAERAQALLAGQIASSVLPMGDALLLLEEHSDQVDLIANFSEAIPDLVSYLTMSNPEWVEENPETVKLFLRLVLEEHRAIAGDPDYLIGLMEQYDAAVDPALLEAVADVYATDTMFDPNGGATVEKLEFSINLFTERETIEAEPAIDPAADDLVVRDLLDDVLDEIGRG